MGTALAVLAVALTGLAAPPGASAVIGFRDILPVGQGQDVSAVGLSAFELTGSPPSSFTNQETAFERLLYDAPAMSTDSLLADFKEAPLTAPPAASRESPIAGVSIIRDGYGVPYVTGATRAELMFGAGYAQAEDRLFEMDILRHMGRADLSEFVGPSFLATDRAVFAQSDYTDAELQSQFDALPARYGAAGARVVADGHAYAAGITAYIHAARLNPSLLPGEYAALHRTPTDWTVTDSIAVAAAISEGFDLGGGAEAQNGELLASLRAKLGARRASATFADLRQSDNPQAPTTTTHRFAFDDPGRVDPASVAAPDPGTLHPRDPVVGLSGSPSVGGPAGGLPAASSGADASRLEVATWIRQLARSRLTRTGGESYAFLIAGRHSASGHPIADMGPQLNFYSPEILSEEVLNGPGISVRGAALPGALPIPIVGHTPSFAWSVTIGVGDHIDTYAERLCNPDGSPATTASQSYLYRGRCVPFVVRDRHEQTLPNASDSSPPMSFDMHTERSVHGPIQATATVGGHPVAYARADATYFHLGDIAVPYENLIDNVNGPQAFVSTVAQSPFSLNWFYIDSRHIAWTLSGTYPIRARGVSADLPSWGTGRWDWQGFDPATFSERHMPGPRIPHAIDPPQGYLANWNNKPAPGWRAADDDYYYGSVHRVQMVSSRIRTALTHGPLTPAGLVGLVEDADTADLRGELVLPSLLRMVGRAPDAATRRLTTILSAWLAAGAHRRDLTRSGHIDQGAAVVLMDAWWSRLVPAMFEPVLGAAAYSEAVGLLPLDDPPNLDAEAYYNGWYGQVATDLTDLLGARRGEPRRRREGSREPRERVPRPAGALSRVYCGNGSAAACRAALLESLRTAAGAVSAAQGTSDPSRWTYPTTCPVPATGPPPCDEIVFTATGAVTTAPIPWQNRPSFQQVVELGGP